MKKIERIQIICMASDMDLEAVKEMIPNRTIRQAWVMVQWHPFECYELHYEVAYRWRERHNVASIIIFDDPDEAFPIDGMIGLAKLEVGEIYHLELKQSCVNMITRNSVQLVSAAGNVAANFRDNIAHVASLKIETHNGIENLQQLVWRDEIRVDTVKLQVKEFTKYRRPVFTVV